MSRYQGLKFKNLLTVFLICGAFLFTSQANALNNYAKEYNGTLTAAEWNGLFSDFVNTMLPVRMNGPLGINTAAPTNPIFLDVNGTVRASAFLGPITGTISAANVSSGTFGGNTGGGNYSFLGNVGIGTTNPTTPLTIQQTNDSSGFKLIGNSDPTTIFSFYIGAGGSNNPRFTSTKSMVFEASNGVYFRGPSGVFINDSNSANILLASGGGNVGIGTTNPAQKLAISGTSLSGTASQSNISAFMGNGLRINGSIGNSSQDAITYQSGSAGAGAAIAFGRDGSYGTFISMYTNPTASGSQGSIVERLRIDQSGNVGIGTTAPAQKLDVNGISVFRGDVHIADNGSTSKFKLSDESTFRKIQTYGSVPLSINPEGNYVGIGTTTPATILDVNGLIKMRTATILSSEDVVNKGYLDSALASTTSGIITQVATSSFWQGSLTGSIYNANTGNVGIGTTNPGEKLVVSGNNIITGRLRVNDTSLGDGALSVMQGANTWGIRLSRLEANGDPSIFFTDDVDNTFLISKPAGTNSLYLSGNVGIGTTNPSQKLHVNGKIYSDSVFVSRFGLSSSELYNTAQTKQIYGLYGGVTSGVDDTFGNLYGIGYAYSTLGGAAFSNQHNIVFTSSGVVKATIGTNNGDLDLKGNSLIAGNVGIGTTAPNDKLSIGLGGAAAPAGSDSTGHNYTNTYLSTDDYALTNYGLVKTLIAGGSGSSVGYWTMSGTNIYNSNSGNVGIGKTNPQFKLDVNLGVVNTNSNIGYNVFADAGANVGYSGYNLQLNNSSANASGYVRLARTAGTTYLGMEIASQSRDGIRFLTHATAPVEAMRINDSGLVGIGITSPQSPLHVYRAGTSEVLRVEASGTSGWIDFRENGTNRGYLGFGDSGQIFSGAATDSLSLRATGSLHLGGGGNSLQMTLNGSNVGIGTTGPTQKLDVSGNIKFASSLISTDLGLTGGGNKAFQIRGAGDGSFYASGIAFDTFYFNGSSYIYDEKIRITSSGNVGIGTTAPNDKLSIGLGGAAAPAGSDSTGHNYTNTYLSTDDYALTNYGLVKTLIAGGSGSSVGYWTMSGTNIYNSNSGNVGIGTTNPGSKLDVSGNINATSLTTASIKSDTTNGSPYTLLTFSGDAWPVNSKAFSFLTYNSTGSGVDREKLAIYSGDAGNIILNATGGNVGIGVTSPDSKLHVVGDNLGRSATVRATSNGNNYFFGHNNTEYLSTIGAHSNNGYPFISFYSYHGTTINTLKRASATNLPSILTVNTSGLLEYKTAQAGVINSDITDFTTRFAIKNDGNVGVGTTNPNAKFEITGAAASGGGTVQTLLVNGATGNGAITINSNSTSNHAYQTYAQGGVAKFEHGIVPATSDFYINPNTQVGSAGAAIYIKKSNGSVGIGTTAPNDKLSIGLGGSVAPAGSDSTGHNYANTYLSTDDYALANYGLVKTLIAGGSGSSVGYWTMSGTNIYNSNSGNVGIGTTTPANADGWARVLDVYGVSHAKSIVTTNSGIETGTYSHNTGFFGAPSGGIIGTRSNHPLSLITNAASRMTILANGNVGIGKINPATALDVNGTVTALAFSGPLSGTISSQNVSAGEFGKNTGGGNFIFGATVAGNVGIGTTNPGSKLSVAGIGASSTPLTLVQLFNNIPYAVSNGVGGARLELGHGILHGYIEAGSTSETDSSTGYLALGTRRPTNNVTEAMRINSSGNVGIGTTDPGAYKLKVAGDVAITGALLTQTGSDFAEEFKAPHSLEAGTVVVMGDEGYKSVKACVKGYDKTVVGIVSDNPSIIAGRTDIDNKNPEKVIVAMMGVVSVNVSDINGSIEKGDLLVSSGISGYAMKSVINRPGTVIGKALENLTGKTGKIKVLVNLQ